MTPREHANAIASAKAIVANWSQAALEADSGPDRINAAFGLSTLSACELIAAEKVRRRHAALTQ